MNTNVTPQKASDIMEAILVKGDLSQLTADERSKYYTRVCESLGLNPLTRPFDYIVLDGKLTLYARKDCTDQLRKIYRVSITELTESEREGVFTVTAKASTATGRVDISTGVVSIAGLRGPFLANAMMKAETKAKRRATLSICGLGFVDESELPAVNSAPSSPESRPRLADQLDALSDSGNVPDEKRKRGRPQKVKTSIDDAYVPDLDNPDAGSFNAAGEKMPPFDPPFDKPDDDWPGVEISDYAYGKADAAAGRMACLNRDIQSDPARLAEWQRGYDSIRKNK